MPRAAPVRRRRQPPRRPPKRKPQRKADVVIFRDPVTGRFVAVRPAPKPAKARKPAKPPSKSSGGSNKGGRSGDWSRVPKLNGSGERKAW